MSLDNLTNWRIPQTGGDIVELTSARSIYFRVSGWRLRQRPSSQLAVPLEDLGRGRFTS
jgi:hypothetical protein